ncbi:MAG: tetratricopeptide repeat protein [Chloroflexota bacterium]
MIWLITRLRRDFHTWERSTRIGFGIGVILLLVALVTALTVPSEVRIPVLGGAGALLLVIEVTVLWGNRGMISAFTRAQRLYLDGDFEAALELLQAVRPKADARALTLLGNTYRQLGRLAESEAVLSEAVDKAPNHYFPIYGFGRTLLSEGRYDEAVVSIRRALELGAPPAVQADLGEAYFRLKRADEAAAALQRADISEPHRALMVGYLLSQLSEAPPPTPDVVQAGLAYWQATAERFRDTPYGSALERDVDEMQQRGTESHG